jgi:hypothetical protein
MCQILREKEKKEKKGNDGEGNDGITAAVSAVSGGILIEKGYYTKCHTSLKIAPRTPHKVLSTEPVY